MYLYVRALQLEGRYPRDIGAWPISAKRIGVGWGLVTERFWPHGEAWPPVEPPGADELAKRHRAGYYQRVRSSHDAMQALASGVPVDMALHVTRQWLQGGTDGTIDLPGPHSDFVGKHAVTLYGYANGRFRFANSWGAEWGDRGSGTIPFEYVDRHIIEGFVNEATPPPYHSSPPRMWRSISPLGHMIHAVYLYDKTTDELEGWAFAFERDGYLDVEELFVRPAIRRTQRGSALARELLFEEKESGMPMRVWVPHADGDRDGLPGVRAMARRLGLSLERSPTPWARYVAVRRSAPPALRLSHGRRVSGQ